MIQTPTSTTTTTTSPSTTKTTTTTTTTSTTQTTTTSTTTTTNREWRMKDSYQSNYSHRRWATINEPSNMLKTCNLENRFFAVRYRFPHPNRIFSRQSCFSHILALLLCVNSGHERHCVHSVDLNRPSRVPGHFKEFRHLYEVVTSHYLPLLVPS